MLFMKLMIRAVHFLVVGMAEDRIGRMKEVVREEVVVALGIVASSAVQSPASRSVDDTSMRVLPQPLNK